MKLTDNNDNNNNDNNDNDDFFEINSEKTETTWDEYRLRY